MKNSTTTKVDKKLLPKEITKCVDTHLHTASFDFYTGMKYAKENNLLQTTEFSQVREGTHFIVCCSDVMVKVESSDYPEITRRDF